MAFGTEWYIVDGERPASAGVFAELFDPIR